MIGPSRLGPEPSRHDATSGHVAPQVRSAQAIFAPPGAWTTTETAFGPAVPSAIVLALPTPASVGRRTGPARSRSAGVRRLPDRTVVAVGIADAHTPRRGRGTRMSCSERGLRLDGHDRPAVRRSGHLRLPGDREADARLRSAWTSPRATVAPRARTSGRRAAPGLSAATVPMPHAMRRAPNLGRPWDAPPRPTPPARPGRSPLANSNAAGISTVVIAAPAEEPVKPRAATASSSRREEQAPARVVILRAPPPAGSRGACGRAAPLRLASGSQGDLGVGGAGRRSSACGLAGLERHHEWLTEWCASSPRRSRSCAGSGGRGPPGGRRRDARDPRRATTGGRPWRPRKAIQVRDGIGDAELQAEWGALLAGPLEPFRAGRARTACRGARRRQRARHALAVSPIDGAARDLQA